MNQRRRIGFAAAAVLALVTQALPGAAAVTRAAEPVTVAFWSIGAEQQFDVPAGVTSIHVVLIGGRGGDLSKSFPISGGFGASLESDLAVAPGTRLYLEVGGNGAGDFNPPGGAGGFNGGGDGGASTIAWTAAGGGGASDIRTVSRDLATSLDSRLVVAAGGGGAGSGGNGGMAGANGNDGPFFSAGGGAASAISGGTGGSGSPAGEYGSSGKGGAGATLTLGPGGGGGGGWFGGGGGGGDSDTLDGGGGGGGGSSYLGSATNVSETIDTNGIPSITISYSTTDSGTVLAQVTVPAAAACIELSTTAIDFGTLALGAENRAATPVITVTNCSGGSETILARGTNATASGAEWALVDGSATCADTLGTDAYRLSLENADSTVGLSTTNKTLQTLAAGADGVHTARIFTACPGSSGAGAVMGMQVVLVATE